MRIDVVETVSFDTAIYPDRAAVIVNDLVIDTAYRYHSQGVEDLNGLRRLQSLYALAMQALRDGTPLDV